MRTIVLVFGLATAACSEIDDVVDDPPGTCHETYEMPAGGFGETAQREIGPLTVGTAYVCFRLEVPASYAGDEFSATTSKAPGEDPAVKIALLNPDETILEGGITFVHDTDDGPASFQSLRWAAREPHDGMVMLRVTGKPAATASLDVLYARPIASDSN
ncbi:MAG: hypothetical protein AB7O24_24635 [Kofleriaceae bacterium]